MREKVEVQKSFKISSVEMIMKNIPFLILANIKFPNLCSKTTKGTEAKIPDINKIKQNIYVNCLKS